MSDDATINTKPQLEIWADDVKCSHGCTTGQLDEEALFYLQSRGISKQSAQAMLLYAFAADVIATIQHSGIKSYFDLHSPITTAIYAGLTVVSVLIVNILLASILFKFSIPTNISQLFIFILIAYPLGYFADIFIYKYSVFGNELDEYYETTGAGVWGALAFVFAIIVSYTLICIYN
jgi:hypothetical protein